jgi:class 3 adenylate cyclase/tetratricopeptide (TPR) repeat protein
MDYDELVTKVIELLQREKRVPYRALKRRFDVDDEYIEDLKVEIIQAKRLAVDEDGVILVWTGDLQTEASPPVQTPQQHTTQETQPTHELSPTEPRPREAERRQLTVMLCDLVASTKLASQLDPEDWRDVVRAYQQVCTEVIQRYDGYIAQLLGNGLLVYFGYPQAHEDDAQRAVRAGLGMLAALGDLNTGLQQAKGVHLAIRVGVHTGLVVVGEMGGAGARERLALGDVPNIASRIEGLATPNTVAISEATFRLVQGYFDCEALGEQTLRGVAEPLHVYRVLQESGARGRLDVAVTRGLTPLVGRESEVTLLLERWEQAKSGQGQVVLLSGDAGIGKSRLVQMLKDHVAKEPHTCWECRSVSYFENTALFPLTDLFHRLWRLQTEDTPDEKLGKLAQALSQYRLPLQETVPLFAPLLSLPVPEHAYPPLHLSPQRQRQKTLEALVAILGEQAEQHPMLFILEDLHWTDPTTLEFLALLLDQTPTASLFVLLTCRPHFQPAWHHRTYLTEITVNRLSNMQAEQVVEKLTEGRRLPPAVLQQLIEKSDGVPLYLEEMTKAVLESGHLKEVNRQYELIGSLASLAIPATLQDSLMARLDRLVTAKAVAQYAAVIGRQFSYALLQAVSQLDAATLQQELGRLVEAEIAYQRGLPPQATYAFKHALIQDAAYQSLLKSTRQQYHQRIVQTLAAQFPETIEAQPELLAHHYTEAGLTEQAVHYWHHAGQRAIKRSAHVEAIAHLRQGLALLPTLPETPEHRQQELLLHIALGESLIATKGFAAPEVGQTYTRARQLCQDLEDPHQLFPVLRGLRNYYHVRAELQMAQALGEQLLSLVQQTQDPVMLSKAHRGLGTTLFFMGAVASAHTHFAQHIALYDLGDWALWCLGYPDQALVLSNEAVTLAQQIAYPLSSALVLGLSAIFYSFRLPSSHQYSPKPERKVLGTPSCYQPCQIVATPGEV